MSEGQILFVYRAIAHQLTRTQASWESDCIDLDLDLDATGDAEFLLSQAFVSATPVGKKRTQTTKEGNLPSFTPLVPTSSTPHSLQELLHSLSHRVPACYSKPPEL